MAMKPKGFVAWYDKITDWSVEDLFVRPHPPGPPRSVFVNQPLPEYYHDKKGRVKKEYKHVSNQVITSKYTILTFIPRNLLEQFRRIANIFFAGIAILQFFHKFSTISPGLVILPLIVVWGITALKDGYEDIKRHQSDRHVNYSEVRVLHGGGWRNPNPMQSKSKTFVRALPRRSAKKHIPGPRAADIQMMGGAAPPEAIEDQVPDESPEPGVETYGGGIPMEEYDDGRVPPAHHGLHVFGTDQHADMRPHWRRTIWEDLRVGDVVKLGDHENVPADILICSTSEDENVCFVETKNLDGETNLKSRHAVSALTHMRSAQESTQTAFEIDCDRPEPHMHKLNAAVVMRDTGERVPVDLQMCLLRGTVIRNTEWIIGVVMYTGRDTKLVLNAGGTPSKRSKVERQMNPMPDDNPSINGLVTWAFALITYVIMSASCIAAGH
ncbi:hypothetical protein EWM64_g9696 [Hericium alpestre]|uniref:P-type ATPase N-terminal domain-containing protein n=1 Tax=Hericium alpestre TaxID=135208 RepID=A0A4Y9ZHV6_9AGAM|nr:hypothetical protein EWM64_g9696 [Hericium alpestre]